MSMENGPANCPECERPVPEGAPGGRCPNCEPPGAAAPTEPARESALDNHNDIPGIDAVAAAFPQLEVLELVGCGGMGVVFKARQTRLDRLVALKLLHKRLARDPQFSERFNREGRFLAKLSHPNIVSVFDIGEAGGFYYLVMEFVDGVNLRQALHAGKLPPAQALSIVPRICDALQYAHENGILHRDIKPENILLDRKGQVKIADFGIAKLVGETAPIVSLTGRGSCLGTPHYMAPEQLERPAEVDHRADIYSLGVVFYEMLTGELPIGRFAPPSRKTSLDDRIDQIVLRALERERELRQRSANEFKQQVERVTRDAPREAAMSWPGMGPTGTKVVRSEAPPAKHSSISLALPWAITALAGLALVALTYGWWTQRAGNSPQPSLPVRSMPGPADGEMGWVEVLDFALAAQQGAAISRGEESTNTWIHFTFTAVEILEEAGRRWLSYDYADRVQGACQRAIRADVEVPGFVGQTRVQSSVAGGADAPEVRHQRLQFLLPPMVSRPAAERLRNDLARVVGKSVKLYSGEEAPLFRLRMANGGTMAGWVCASAILDRNAEVR